MRPQTATAAPADAEARRQVAPVVCYPVETLPRPDLAAYRAARGGMELVERLRIAPREGGSWTVPAGHFFRIVSV